MHNYKKYGLIIFLVIIISLCQQGIFSNIRVFGVAFDLSLVFIVCYSLIREDVECIVVAILLGIVRDSFFPSIFGVNTIVYIVTAYVLCRIEKKIYKDAILIPMFSIFVFTLAKGLMYFGFLYIASIKYNFINYLVNVVLIEAAINSILGIFIFRFVSKINSIKFMQEEWKF